MEKQANLPAARMFFVPKCGSVEIHLFEGKFMGKATRRAT